MKILHVISGLEAGGAELFLERLLQTMDASEFEPAVVSLEEIGPIGRRLQHRGIAVHALGAGFSPTGIAAILKMRKVTCRLAPDLIQGWLYHGNLGASLARRAAGLRCPVVWNVRHSLDGWREETAGLRALIRLGGMLSGSAARIVFNSEMAARQHERLGYPKVKAVIIPNGFDCERFRPDAALRLATRRELEFDSQAIVIGMVARYHAVKDHETFLQAAHILLEQAPMTRFLLAGKGAERQNPALRRLLEKSGLTERAPALGEREDIPALMNALDICVSSSRAEGFPNAVGEAMACGVPCVVTGVGASAELVGDTGRVVPARAPESLAAALLELVRAGTAARKQLGAAARERILRQYEQGAIMHRYAELYCEVAAYTQAGRDHGAA